jgi:hypothetical protein
LIAAGPFGFLAAAGIGATIGVIGLLKKSAEQKIVDRVRETYKVTISRSFASNPLFGIIKQTFGGDIGAGIQSQQVRDLIELYAMSTGQSLGGFGSKFAPVSLVQTASGLFQAPQYYGGNILPSIGGSIPNLSIQGGQPTPTAAPTQQVIQIMVPGAQEFFRNETVNVVLENGRAVQTSATNAQKRNIGRLEGARLAFAPNLVMS